MSRGIVVDLYAGGGGTSLGLEWAFGRSPDIAINHDPEAVAMHMANHPNTKHYTEDVRKVDILKVTGGRPVAFLWLSPDCKHHSKAKGGKPVDRKIRGLAWEGIRWGKIARPSVIVLENVEEFRDWGPLDKSQRPDRSRRGFTYRRFKAEFRKLGYVVEDRVLVACDYGTPTTRKRLFLVARCDGRPIVWPKQTHAKDGAGGLKPWRTAAECIDFSIPCHSIFLSPEEAKVLGVRRPLAEKTQRRIYRGIERFVINSPRPFIVPMYHQNAPKGLDEPLQTITTQGNKFNVVAPALVPVNHGGDLRAHGPEEPLRTITGAHRGEEALAAALLVPRYGEREGQEPRALSVEQPSPTIVPTQNGGSLVAAHLSPYYGLKGNEARGSDPGTPLPTITGDPRHAVVALHLAKHYGGHEATGSQLRLPIDTITARDHNAVVASSLVKLKGTSRDGLPVDGPLHTIQAGGYHYAEVRAFLTRYNGQSLGQQLDIPASTLDATDRLGLVMVEGIPHAIVDIAMRMLIARELYRCQGFPDSYLIDIVCQRVVRGKKVRGRLPAEAQVRMCGNSVPPQLAEAMALANAPAELEDAA